MTVSKESRAIRRMFADISPRYDLLNRVLSLRVDQRWRRRTVKALGVRPSDAVLDVCTGTADLALALAESVDESVGGHVVGTDFCPEMVAIGEEKRRRKDETRLRLLVADTLELPFEDESFDIVTVAFGIRNVADLGRGLAEIHRVLRPGGRAGILEFTTPERRWMRSAFGLYFHRVLPRIGRWLSRSPSGGDAYRYLPDSVAEFPSPAKLAERLESVGFHPVEHRLLSMGIAALHIGTRPTGGTR